jgi:hypothetical protein
MNRSLVAAFAFLAAGLLGPAPSHAYRMLQ